MFLLLLVDKFKKRKYPTLDMVHILKATKTVGTRALKPSSGTIKELRSKMEQLIKDHYDRAVEEAPPKSDMGKEKALRNAKSRKSWSIAGALSQ